MLECTVKELQGNNFLFSFVISRAAKQTKTITRYTIPFTEWSLCEIIQVYFMHWQFVPQPKPTHIFHTTSKQCKVVSVWKESTQYLTKSGISWNLGNSDKMSVTVTSSLSIRLLRYTCVAWKYSRCCDLLPWVGGEYFIQSICNKNKLS